MCLERQDFYFLLQEKEKLLESSLKEKEGGIIKNVWLANKHTCRDDDNDEGMKRAMKEYIQMKRMSGQLFLVLNSRSSLSLFWRTLSFLLSLLIASNFPLLSFIFLPPSLFAHDFAFGPSMGLGHWRCGHKNQERNRMRRQLKILSFTCFESWFFSLCYYCSRCLLWNRIRAELEFLMSSSFLGVDWLEKLSGSRGRERGNETCKFPTYAADHRFKW